MYFLFYAFILFTIQMPPCLSQECGTLVVRYQTGPKEERLDRVRFRIWNEQQEEQFYPKTSSQCGHNGCQHRMVVVENLPVGHYKLQFLVPNTDHLFEEIPEKLFEIHNGEVLKINQFIRPRDSSAKNSIPPKSSTMSALMAMSEVTKPAFTAMDVNHVSSPSLCYVAGEKSIIGDPFNDMMTNALPSRQIEVSAFSIGTYEV